MKLSLAVFLTKKNYRLENPLKGIPHDKLWEDALSFAKEFDLQEDSELIAKGALVAQDPKRFELLPQLTEDDKEAIRREKTHKLHQTRELWLLVACCSVGAVVQGMDETVCIFLHAVYCLTTRRSSMVPNFSIQK